MRAAPKGVGEAALHGGVLVGDCMRVTALLPEVASSHVGGATTKLLAPLKFQAASAGIGSTEQGVTWQPDKRLTGVIERPGRGVAG